MKLREVLKDISFELIQGSLDVDIEDIFYDSRKVTLNSAFIALVGVNSDGHDYIDMAIEKAKRCKTRPTAIILDTVKGKGVKFIEEMGVGNHSFSFGAAELEKALAELN